MKNFLYLLVIASAPILTSAAELEIKIPSQVPYQDVEAIQDNVVAECKTLGSDFSEHIAKGLESEGFSAKQIDPLDTSTGTVFDVKITQVYSGGNAFIGHMKSVSAIVTVYKDGKPLPAKKFKRDTRGGFAGGFKGSCSVLDRSINAIGIDIARWYKKQE